MNKETNVKVTIESYRLNLIRYSVYVNSVFYVVQP